MNAQYADVRQHILDAAKPIIVGKGFSAVGLSELLAAADVPKGSFYHYFKSKEAFGEALLDNYFDRYLASLDVLLGESRGSAADRLVGYWQRWQETQCGDDLEAKCLAVKLGSEVADLSEPMRLALNRGTRRVVQRIATCIAAAREEGSLPASLDPQGAALALYSEWLGATVLEKIWRDGSALQRAMDVTLQILGRE